MHFCANTTECGLKTRQSSTFIHFRTNPTEHTLTSRDTGSGTSWTFMKPKQGLNVNTAFYRYALTVKFFFHCIYLFCFVRQSYASDFIRNMFFKKKKRNHPQICLISKHAHAFNEIRNVWKVLDEEFVDNISEDQTNPLGYQATAKLERIERESMKRLLRALQQLLLNRHYIRTKGFFRRWTFWHSRHAFASISPT